MKTLHETDFHAWLTDQIDLAKKNDFQNMDWKNLIEEMEDLGDHYHEAIESHLTIIFIHKLKHLMQPRECKSWDDSIHDGIFQIQKKISRHPSLKNYPRKVFYECYEDARRAASRQTEIDLRKFPKDCPWTFEEILGE